MTLLALDLAANSSIKDPTAYTYASPRTGDPAFVLTYNQVVAKSFRIANRIDLLCRSCPSPRSTTMSTRLLI